MKTNTWYACPTCKSMKDTHAEAEKCKQSHPVEKRVQILCPKCKTGFNSWNCGGELLTLQLIDQHIARNCDKV